MALSLMALPAWAQGNLPAPVLPPTIGDFPAPVQPTQPQAPLPVPSHSTPAIDPVPVVSAPPTAVVPPIASDAVSKTAALTTPLLVAQWRTHKSTPQEAWDKGTLTVDNLIYILNHSIDYWGGFYWEKDVDLRRAIVALLVEHGGERLAKPETLSPFVRLWLADYYESVGDERTLPLCEGVLSEIKTPVKGEGALAFQAVERIGWYYRDKGQYEQGAQAWLRMTNYHADIGWWTPDALIEAARLWERAGENEKAANLYAKIARLPTGDEIIKAVALQLQAKILIRQNHIEEARKLLQAATANPTPTASQVIALSLLGYSYYNTRNWREASRYWQQSLAQADTLSSGKVRLAMADALSGTRELLASLNLREKMPIQCDPAEIAIVAVRDKREKSLNRTLFITTEGNIPLSLTSSDSRLKFHLEASPWTPSGQNTPFERILVLEMLPDLLEKAGRISLFISSSTFPTAHIEVPVRIEVKNP